MHYYAITNPGSRHVNEDCLGVIEHSDLACFVVADGLGGHGKGEVASQLAVKAFDEVFSSPMEKPLPDLLSDAFRRAQSDILKEQARTNMSSQMKTTVVVLAVRNGELAWGHLGDSRLYAFTRNKVKSRTLDHSVPQMLAISREIREKDIRGHQDRNRLLRVLGVSEDPPRFELSELQRTDKFQAFLLCSDGFWELITEKEMEKLLKKSHSPNEWMEQMRAIVEKRGLGTDMDNYSAIAVFL